jgi:D-alanine-D-alanine ligase
MKVVVLLGGASSEREVSLATGRGVVRAFRDRGHEVVAVDPATGERLEVDGSPAPAIGEAPPDTPDETSAAVRDSRLALARSDDVLSGDVVFVALHGGAGEDGTLQALLDLAGVRYTGSGMLASALAMDKTRAKVMMKALGVPSPKGKLLRRTGSRTLDPKGLGGYPLVVKPNREGSSVGVFLVNDDAELAKALEEAFRFGDVLVETYIPGRELTVAVLGGKALPVVEIEPEDGWYDYRHKYTKGHTKYHVPADLPPTTATEIARLAEKAYQALGCAGVARVDFRLDDTDQAFCLEVNTIPGLTETSLVPMAARAAGIGYGDLVERLLHLALEEGESS